MTKIFRAWYDSRSFHFECYSKTKDGAINTMKQALKDHTEQYKLEDDWYYEDSIEWGEFKLDTGYRDRSQIIKD